MSTEDKKVAEEQAAQDLQNAQPEVEVVEEEFISEESSEEQAEIENEELDSRLATLEAALEQSENRIHEQRDSVLRAKADVENMRRRSTQEVDKARKFALERILNDLLPVIDNMERAIEASDKENEATKAIVEGVELTLSSLLSTVDKNGLKVIAPEVGDGFNPELHQAMSIQENPDLAPNSVMLVMQKGYELNGRIIRPAMVMVSK
ncbi:nucleotide exchange factor GrpE [Vibrio sp. SS-MA-C1-2]|uniref:nucleotide exchange factor GrpE n=1 Tax=Vibrio sp. SS-MA-C1-2 TaxID=2908646 RepID=UPI001F337D33|nr:nucleotide exchange factor GrpE [Vibrio sp. SS-MA-C1-2]UJF19000.1 nucleotide exchange factor GrpE [Vibrio sp. SS-MA-C1-2]